MGIRKRKGRNNKTVENGKTRGGVGSLGLWKEEKDEGKQYETNKYTKFNEWDNQNK